jgi:hypothetical protein
MFRTWLRSQTRTERCGWVKSPDSASTGNCLSGRLPQEMQGNCSRFQTCFANTVCILSGTLIPVAAYPLMPSAHLTLTEEGRSLISNAAQSNFRSLILVLIEPVCSLVRGRVDLFSIPLQCDAHQLTSCPDANLSRDQVPAYAQRCRAHQDKIESGLLVG